MEQEDQRNFFLAMVLMVGFIWAYQVLVIDPETRRREAAEAAAAVEQTAPAAAAEPEIASAPLAASVGEALAQSARIPFDGPGVDGSIRVAGARIDDLNLRRHFETVEREEEVRLFQPENARHGYYASYYWLDEDGRAITGADADWRVVEGERLTPETPVTLEIERDGLRVSRRISLDENYMFTFADTVTNLSGEERLLRPYGSIRRHGDYRSFLPLPEHRRNVFIDLAFGWMIGPQTGYSTIAHQGLIGVLDGSLKLRKYPGLEDGKGIPGRAISDQGGWIGFTDKYWMGALIPQQDLEFSAAFNRRARQDEPLLEVRTEGAEMAVPAGGRITVENRLFAGAKRLEVLNAYSSDLGIPRFNDAVDWGFLYFLTKPFFAALTWLRGLLGSFGLAILAFTVIVKLVLYPLYSRSYRSMAKMRKLTEPMKAISEQYKDDPQGKQKAVMELYQREKVNPVAGCLPILLTIPVFFALYKTLSVTLEMRHESFLYLKDLSAPDPTAIGNLFGILPWAAEAVRAVPLLGIFLGVGLLPILYGVTMWALQSLSPPPPDPNMRIMMQVLPFGVTLLFAGFAGGLVIYWLWSNILTIAQQYVIMRRSGVETELDKLIARWRGRGEAET